MPLLHQALAFLFSSESKTTKKALDSFNNAWREISSFMGVTCMLITNSQEKQGTVESSRSYTSSDYIQKTEKSERETDGKMVTSQCPQLQNTSRQLQAELGLMSIV